MSWLQQKHKFSFTYSNADRLTQRRFSQEHLAWRRSQGEMDETDRVENQFSRNHFKSWFKVFKLRKLHLNLHQFIEIFIYSSAPLQRIHSCIKSYWNVMKFSDFKSRQASCTARTVVVSLPVNVVCKTINVRNTTRQEEPVASATQAWTPNWNSKLKELIPKTTASKHIPHQSLIQSI